MSAAFVLYVIVGILIFNYLLETIISLLDNKQWQKHLPNELIGITDEDKYQKAKAYDKANFSFSIISSSFSLVLMLIVLICGILGYVDSLILQYTSNSILRAMMFFAIIGVASDILSTPFSWYETFVIEQKFGFNKMTVKTFFLDKLKGWLLTAIIGGGILALIIMIYESSREMFWMYSWIALSSFSLFMLMFYSNLIVPLFNKQEPLAEGELKEAIFAFARKVGFNLTNIYVIDGSKRSSKGNAYFTGLGPKKRIVLYDTLIKEMTTEEVVAVLAHEIGHYKKKHTLIAFMSSIVQTGVMFYLLSLFLGNPIMSEALGVMPNIAANGVFHIEILAFGMLYSPLSMILSLFMNAVSRKNEYQADAYAGINYNASSLKSALKCLSVNHLSNLHPHKFSVWFHYSHPPLLARLSALSKYVKENDGNDEK